VRFVFQSRRRFQSLWEHFVHFGQRHRTPLSEGNAVRLVDDGEAWMELLHERIAAARRSLDFEIYIWADDPSGRGLLQALQAARARGVRVRGLVDALGSWDAWSMVDEARRGGLDLRWYHPISLQLPWRKWHRRNHRKLLVIDGRWALVGSANWGMDYDCTLNGACHRDLGVVLRGPVVADLEGDFEEAWRYGEPRPGLSPAPLLPAPREAEEELGSEWHRGVSIQLVSSFSSGIGAIRRHLRLALGQIRRSLVIANPYFIPDPRLKRLLVRLARRGVQIDLLLPGHTDHRLVQAASRAVYPEMLRAGIRIRERQERLLHSKAAVLDNEVVVIGSANLDMRSFRYNRELNLVMRHPALAQALERALIHDLASSERIPEGNPRGWRRWVQRLAYLFWRWL